MINPYQNYNPYNAYNPYNNAYNPMQQSQYTAPAKYEITRVNGKGGAEAFQMQPNSATLLLDETAPVVWLKQTDGAGYATITPYSITPMQTQEQQESDKLNELEKRIAELEGLVNAKSNSTSSQQKQPYDKSK